MRSVPGTVCIVSSAAGVLTGRFAVCSRTCTQPQLIWSMAHKQWSRWMTNQTGTLGLLALKQRHTMNRCILGDFICDSFLLAIRFLMQMGFLFHLHQNTAYLVFPP